MINPANAGFIFKGRGAMYLTAEKVVNGLVCAQRVLSDPRVWNGSSAFLPISIDATKDVVQELSGYAVTMRSVSFEGVHVYARIEKYADKTAKIDVKHTLDEQWKRFVAAKELLHLIIDQEEDMSPYGDQTLDKLVRDGHIGVISQNGDGPPAQSELIAEVAAMELLYPIQNRESDLVEVRENRLTFSKLAIRYGMPVNFIDTVLSEGYLRTMRAAFAEIQKEKNA